MLRVAPSCPKLPSPEITLRNEGESVDSTFFFRVRAACGTVSAMTTQGTFFGVLPVTCAAEFITLYLANGDITPLPSDASERSAELIRRAARMQSHVQRVFPTFRDGQPSPIEWSVELIREHLNHLFELVGEPHHQATHSDWVVRHPERWCTNERCLAEHIACGMEAATLDVLPEPRKHNQHSSAAMRQASANARVLCDDGVFDATILFGRCPSCGWEYHYDMIVEKPTKAAQLIGIAASTRRCAAADIAGRPSNEHAQCSLVPHAPTCACSPPSPPLQPPPPPPTLGWHRACRYRPDMHKLEIMRCIHGGALGSCRFVHTATVARHHAANERTQESALGSTETLVAYQHLIAQSDCIWGDAHHAPFFFDLAYFHWSIFRRQTLINEFWRARGVLDNVIPMMIPGALNDRVTAAHEYQRTTTALEKVRRSRRHATHTLPGAPPYTTRNPHLPEAIRSLAMLAGSRAQMGTGVGPCVLPSGRPSVSHHRWLS